MSNIFRASRVNGLSNALYEKMKNATSYDAFNSESCFQFLKDDETYNIKEQAEEIMSSENAAVFGQSTTFGYGIITAPNNLYDPETESWSDEYTYGYTAGQGATKTIMDAGYYGVEFDYLFGAYSVKIFGEVDMEASMQSGMALVLTEPEWRKVVFKDNNDSQDSENSTEIKRVSGLYNALSRKFGQIRADDAMDTDACFEFLAKDETYNLKNQIENYVFDAYTSMYFSYYPSMVFDIMVPTVLWDAERNEWSEEIEYTTIPFTLTDNNLETYGLDVDTPINASGKIGKYICNVDLTIGEGNTISVSSISWGKIAFED